MGNLYYVEAVIASICKDQNRDKPKVLQRYLCVVIFPQWDIFCTEYKKFSAFKECKDIETFLSVLFEIDCIIVKSVLRQLEIYKNYNMAENDTMNTCCNIKLSL